MADKPQTMIETGVDLSLPFSTPYNAVKDGTKRSPEEQGLQELSREGWVEDDTPTVRQLVTMRRVDGQARALYRLITYPMRSALSSASILPDDNGEEEAEFIRNVFFTPAQAGGMTIPIQRVMSQLFQAIFDGFAAFEKVFWIPEDGPLKGKITLRKLAYRPAETITFITDKNSGFKGLRQQATYAGHQKDTFIPKDYAFYYAAQEEERPFYGVSLFQSAFYHYDKKIKLYYTAHLAAQRAAVGTRIGHVPPNASPTAVTEFKAMLSNMSVAQWMTVPEGFKVEILREAGSFDFLNLINHHSNQMSKSVLAAFFDMATGRGSNDATLVNFAQPGDEMFILMLRTIMDEVADQLNFYVIPQLIDLNFKKGRYPKFTWGTLTDEQRASISAIFEKVAVGGQQVNLPKEFTRELEKLQAKEMGLEVDWDEVEKREEAEQAKAEALEQAMYGTGGAGAGGAAPVTPEAGAEGAPTEETPEDMDEILRQFEDTAADLAAADSEVALSHARSGESALTRLAREMLKAVDEEENSGE